MRMSCPAHPGEILKELWFKPLGLTITEAARILGVTRKALSELVNGRAGISINMAVRLSLAFDTTPESWLHSQMVYDLWQCRKSRGKYTVDRKKIRRIRRVAELNG